MNNLVKALLIGMLLITFNSCENKNTPIKELDELSTDLKNNGDHYTEEDWISVTEELNNIETELEQYSHEYTDEELKEIGHLKGVCAAYLFKQNLKTTSRQIHDAIMILKGGVDGVMETITEDSTYWDFDR